LEKICPIVSCYAEDIQTNDGVIEIYVMDEYDKLRWVSNPDIADSYNIRWRKEAKYIHCDLYEYGEDAIMKTTYRLANDGDVAFIRSIHKLHYTVLCITILSPLFSLKKTVP